MYTSKDLQQQVNKKANSEHYNEKMIAASNVLRTPIRHILKEANILFQYSRSDLTATVTPHLIMIFSLFPLQPSDKYTLLLSTMRCLVYAFCYCMVFVTSNQVYSEAEDAIEKPFRPIPSGLISMQGAKNRAVIWACLYLALSFMLGVGHWGALWFLVSVHHNLLGGHQHWFTKNCIFISSGVAVIMGSVWQITYGSMTVASWKWTVGISLWSGFLFNIQDYRDVKGDKVSRRATMALIYGDISRWVVAASAILFGLILSTTLLIISRSHVENFIALSLGVGHVVMSCHLLLRKDHEGDKISYKILLLLFNTILATSGLWLR